MEPRYYHITPHKGAIYRNCINLSALSLTRSPYNGREVLALTDFV